MKTITQFIFLFAFAAVGFAQTRTTAFIDFGHPETTTEGYNNITSFETNTDGSFAELVDTEGNTTGITLAIDNNFGGRNRVGTTEPGGNISFASTATSDSFYGTTTLFAGETEPSGGFILTGLQEDMYYSFSIFASRVGDNGGTIEDNRTTLYTVEGATTGTASLNASNNTDERVLIERIQADENGTISFTAEPGEGNNNINNFYYLGAIELVMSTDPDLSTKNAELENALAVYPNPVASSAQISLNLKEKTQLKVSVYDLSGRLVETIVNGEQAAGNFSTTWNRSSNLSAGLYILQIDANGKRVNTKLMLK